VGSAGSYVLVLQLTQDARLRIGRLGLFTFEAGFYCYCGSAMGPGGLEARLARHLRQRKKPHWHVDHLLQHAVVVEIWRVPSKERLECLCAQALLGVDGASLPIPGFGSSDCTCRTHLLHFPSLPPFGDFCAQLRALGTRTPLRRQVLYHPSQG
jgi:Uri superfamily endonuclease